MNATEKLIATEIKKYFGTHKFHYDISTFGQLAVVDLTYQDFHPVPVVREWMNSHIPFLLSLNVERTYSRKIEHKTEIEIVENDPQLYLRVEELLFFRDLA